MSWSECSSSCGAAERSRRRYCDNGAVGLPGCTADSDGRLDDHVESCDNQLPCLTVSKCPTGTLSTTDGCSCEEKPSLKLLVPLSISATESHDIKNGLVFTHGPDMQFTIGMINEFFQDSIDNVFSKLISTMTNRPVKAISNHSQWTTQPISFLRATLQK